MFWEDKVNMTKLRFRGGINFVILHKSFLNYQH